MVSALFARLRDPCLKADRDFLNSMVFLCKTIHCHSVSIHAGVEMGATWQNV